jgi:tetratricopeptide (TPR) repeat protein
VGEHLLSPRGLAVLFLALAAVFTLAGWLRPPLSVDIDGLRLPVFPDNRASPAEFLREPRRLAFGSVGSLLLPLIAGGGLLVLWRPRFFPLVAGALLCVALGSNAAVALNHPALIEALDFEQEQRQQMVELLTDATDTPVSTPQNGRVHDRSILTGCVSAAPVQDSEWADMTRGWVYLLYGRWLVFWAAFGLVCGTSGAWPRRLAVLAGWTLLGLCLGGGLCFQRLHAEYWWSQATSLEARGDCASSRRALEKAVAISPALERLERTWLLSGKLDYRQGRTSPRERFYRSFQAARSPRGDPDWGEAMGLVQDMLAGGGEANPAARHQAARLWTAAGLTSYRHQNEFKPFTETDRRRSVGTRAYRLAAAADAWQRAANIDPDRRDCGLYSALAMSTSDPAAPYQAQVQYDHATTALADRILRADLLTCRGDSYFQAGRMTEARQQYAESFTVFSLAKTINFRAMKGLGGL